MPADYSGQNLSSASFKGRDLRGANFSGAVLNLIPLCSPCHITLHSRARGRSNTSPGQLELPLYQHHSQQDQKTGFLNQKSRGGSLVILKKPGFSPRCKMSVNCCTNSALYNFCLSLLLHHLRRKKSASVDFTYTYQEVVRFADILHLLNTNL